MIVNLSLFAISAFILLNVIAHGHHHHHHHHGAEIPKDHIHGHFHKTGESLGASTNAHHGTDLKDSFLNSVLDFLFPTENPMYNSFLSTFYISFFPNLLLLFVPSQIRASSLNVLVSFAVGGLLGDVFLHLLPHTFMDAFSSNLSPENLVLRNICIGLALFFGCLGFYFLDKVLRILSGNKGHSHTHGHTHEHSHANKEEDTSGKSSSLDIKRDNTPLRKRKAEKGENNSKGKEIKEKSKEVKLSAFLNLIADFSHNFTDGLAIAASFYFSKSIGISTTIAVFFHEIPHEIGDFAILLQSGFTRLQALSSQFVTAIGAMLGTAAGVAIQEYFKQDENDPTAKVASKLFGYLPLAASDLVLPITAGGFLYIATVSVIPELLEVPNDLETNDEKAGKFAQISQLIKEILAMLLGVALMALVSLYE